MVNPNIMCRKHLLGEHLELHMLVGGLEKGRSIKGFLDKGLLEPQNIFSRHEKLVQEMISRRYNHKSPIIQPELQIPQHGYVSVFHSICELTKRCPRCREKFLKRKNNGR